MRMSFRISWRGLPGCSSWFPGTEVEGAQDGSWRRRYFARLYLAAKPSHVGIDLYGQVCSLHRPMVRGCPMRGHSFLSCVALSQRITVGGGAISGGAKPVGLDIWCSVDRLSTCVTKSYMVNLIFTRTCLSYARVIMAIMRVSLVELLCQMAMRWILAL
jgi:hypothetical protein